VRFHALLVVAGGVAVLAVAAYLNPDRRGYGTHTQLGGGPCGMLLWTGLPCPTCGMTTAFAHTVRGQWGRAFWAQPSGFLLALATVAAVGVGLWSLATGRVPPLDCFAFRPSWLFLALLVLLVGGWGFKLVAGLLTGVLPAKPG